MAFFAKISDPAVGGTYMTLLNTLTNLGGNWPSTLALWIIDQLTWKRCDFGSSPKNISESNVCDGTEQTSECESNGGKCIGKCAKKRTSSSSQNYLAKYIASRILPQL